MTGDSTVNGLLIALIAVVLMFFAGTVTRHSLESDIVTSCDAFEAMVVRGRKFECKAIREQE